VWYSPTSFTIDVNVSAGNSYDLELYFLDYDARGRAETVTLSDFTTSAVLNTQTVSNFANGEYLSWAITGNVLITIKCTGPANGVLSGLFFDPVGTVPAVKTATAAAQSGSASGNVIDATAVGQPTSAAMGALDPPSAGASTVFFTKNKDRSAIHFSSETR
jgi:hypothetical protein